MPHLERVADGDKVVADGFDTFKVGSSASAPSRARMPRAKTSSC